MSESNVNPLIINSSLNVEIQGPPVIQLEDIISIRFSENLTRCSLFEVIVNNWDSLSHSYKYSEGSLLHLGSGIRLYSGTFIMANGTITTLAPSFPELSTSILTFSMDAKHLPQNLPAPVVWTALQLNYGSQLLEFHPVLRIANKLSQPTVQATGTAAGLPMLMAGVILKISGVGAAWSGDYSVTETTHTFDLKSGYRTSFICSKL